MKVLNLSAQDLKHIVKFDNNLEEIYIINFYIDNVIGATTLDSDKDEFQVRITDNDKIPYYHFGQSSAQSFDEGHDTNDDGNGVSFNIQPVANPTDGIVYYVGTNSYTINYTFTNTTTTSADYTDYYGGSITISEQGGAGHETGGYTSHYWSWRDIKVVMNADGIDEADVGQVLLMSARTLIEKEPNYSYVAAGLLLDQLRQEALTFIEGIKTQATHKEMKENYQDYFKKYIKHGAELELLDYELTKYDLARLSKALRPDCDRQFTYLGLQTLYDRYFIHSMDVRFELPQAFFMRVAMGLAINEPDRNERAIEFYELLSSFNFMSSTPTLFNSGTRRPQLSSCYLTTVPDDLDGIFSAIKDDALLSKFAGGLGNDWTPVRALGTHIKGTNGKSQGVVPFLKVANDTAVAVNQGGKRKGAMCAYLETWHLDIEEFLDLRKNTGDDRRRAHDMNTANWIPDLFMKRVFDEEEWTLFSPNDVPDLHDLYGKDFEARYKEYEQMTATGQLTLFKRIPALTLWRKMLSHLFETGHPWITFKDVCNLRSPQQHTGVVHSSNLCTEITLNTGPDETAVCNLGSVVLDSHLDKNGNLDHEKLRATIRVAVGALDNVIDLNFYPTQAAKTANLRHRPVGLGVMGLQNCLYRKEIPFASNEAVEFNDEFMEAIAYYAYEASSDLAKERGTYSTYKGSKWDRGILPQDSLDLLEEERGQPVDVKRGGQMDWAGLRDKISKQGMRNSNVLAIAPTATISNIMGSSPCIEPLFKNLFTKSNLSGSFIVLNQSLVRDLKKHNLWNGDMIDQLKYNDGELTNIAEIPDELKKKYQTAFGVLYEYIIDAAARRQKWIDQSQSVNLFLAEPKPAVISKMYLSAWRKGLKTTYYLRTQSASNIEKATVTTRKASDPETASSEGVSSSSCSITDPDCEACQ